MVISKYVEESAILVLSDLDEDEAVISDQISVQIVGLCLYGNPSPHQISLLLIFVGTWIGAFYTALVLRYFNPNKPSWLETDASSEAISGILY